uniref:Uncharacterized protein n=1 Tax=Brassica campestris TaxID=3711 RepID=A0A3P5ZCG3_BRACM|nr:unnamed protein product [Brassica rapa]
MILNAVEKKKKRKITTYSSHTPAQLKLLYKQYLSFFLSQPFKQRKNESTQHPRSS